MIICYLVEVYIIYCFDGLCFSPITYAWQGGTMLSKDNNFQKLLVTKQDYEEFGHSICEEKFDV